MSCTLVIQLRRHDEGRVPLLLGQRRKMSRILWDWPASCGAIGSAWNIGYLIDTLASIKASRDLGNRKLTHSVYEQVCLGVDQDGSHELVGNVVVMD